VLLIAALNTAPASGETMTAPSAQLATPPIATFSIVARDPGTGDLGVAVQSKYFAVGSVVPHGEAGTGAVATQARGNPLHGRDGLALLRQGWEAERVLARLTAADPLRRERQIGIVDLEGRSASHTGEDCLPWAGGRTGPNYAVQGNVLAGPQVVDAMAEAFETSQGDLATRMLEALAAGQAAGGDLRGRQSAAVLVVRDGAGYLGLSDRLIDLHVEDHPTPIAELRRLLDIRLGQLALAAAGEQLHAAAGSDAPPSGEQLERALKKAREAVALNPQDDHAWWVLAEIQLQLGERPAAAEAARRALLVNPSWRSLPAATRQALGVSDAMIAELRTVERFARIWDKLAPAAGTAP
jgi:uncharacterized Ntn-hydrolase superfamily protein